MSVTSAAEYMVAVVVQIKIAVRNLVISFSSNLPFSGLSFLFFLILLSQDTLFAHKKTGGHCAKSHH
jgi:hypothetical protein